MINTQPKYYTTDNKWQFEALNPDDVNQTVFQIIYYGTSLPTELKLKILLLQN